MEERIQKSYQKYHANAFQTLLHLYQGNYWSFSMSGLIFIIKHLTSWLIPIAIAKVINAASSKDSSQLLTNYFHVKYHSTSIRQV